MIRLLKENKIIGGERYKLYMPPDGVSCDCVNVE